MEWSAFKRKWLRCQGKETPAYQGHFAAICRLLGQPGLAEAVRPGIPLLHPAGSKNLSAPGRSVVISGALWRRHPEPGSDLSINVTTNTVT
jgi:hypothetical protein